MNSLQTLIIKTRQDNKTSIAFSASKLGISESVLIQIESTPLLEINIPYTVLQTYISRYAEYLGIKQESIAPALYLIEKHYGKASKAGKKTWFDYLNYIIIILLLIFLAYSVHTLYQKNKQQPREKQTFIIPPPLMATNSEPLNMTTDIKSNTKLKKLITKDSQGLTHNTTISNTSKIEAENFTVAEPPSLDQESSPNNTSHKQETSH